MGIPGLLPALASVTRPAHVQEYRGQTVAVDAYVWLHRGAYACSSELCLGIPTDKYIAYCMKMVRMLQHFGVKPILVFDGGNLPIKREQESTRRSRRKENKQKAMELMREGNKSAANEFFQKAVDVTSRMAYNLIQVLKQENVDYIVAPYEADAQMAFLSMNGIVDAVITEDSDLVPYGATKILFKMDQMGQGKEIRRENLDAARDMDLRGWTQSMIRHMCIMAGCDYLEGLNGFGVKKAHTWIRKYKDDMERIFTLLRADRNVALPADYETRFKQADLTFQHQRVYDPRTKTIRPLTDFPVQLRDLEGLDFIGPDLTPEVAFGIATAVLDPHNKEPFEQVIAAAMQRLPSGSSSSPAATATAAAATTPTNKMDRDAALFQPRRGPFGSPFGSPASSTKKGCAAALPLPSPQTRKLESYFGKVFKPPSKTTTTTAPGKDSQSSAATAASAASSQLSSTQMEIVGVEEDIIEEADVEDDDDADLSNITRDSDDPEYDDSFERMKSVFGVAADSTKRLTSSTGDLKATDEAPPLRRAKTEPIASSASPPPHRGPKVIHETPPRDVVVSRFFSGPKVSLATKLNDEVVKIVSDDIFDILNEEEPAPVVRKLDCEFDDVAPVKTDMAAAVVSSQDGATASHVAAAAPSVGSTIADMSQNSPVSSASTDSESGKQQQPLMDEPTTNAIPAPAPTKLERPKTVDLKSLFAYSAQIKRKSTPPPVASSQQRRLSLPPPDHSKAINVDEDDCDMDNNEEEEPSGFNTSKDSSGFDTQVLEDSEKHHDAASVPVASSRRPSLDSVLTGGLENKENSRTAASNVFSRFAFGSGGGSKIGSPSTAPSTPTVRPKKRKSPSPSQSNLSIQDTLASFAIKKQKTTEDTMAPVPSPTRTPLGSAEPFVIPDSDEEI
eukprot:TRINITY_DN3842_c0_g1_i1.p1 TRINITY_DN3842_c0_g1~~TRINITY_DN3842_c0_g1_i1.p1  ORF type:complete len:902 (-),score=200.96 TRINITY_DN3842_c0_g1_i1:136-2841(-)